MLRKRISAFCITVAIMLVFFANGNPALADLVGHWKFDEGVGTTANDSSGLQ